MIRALLLAWILMLAVGVFHGSHPGIPTIGYLVAVIITAACLYLRRRHKIRRARRSIPTYQNGRQVGQIR